LKIAESSETITSNVNQEYTKEQENLKSKTKESPEEEEEEKKKTTPTLLSDLLDEEPVGDEEDEDDQQQQLASTSSSDKIEVERTETTSDVKLKCKDETETVINVGLKKVSNLREKNRDG
jgi:hypothetical protein